MAYPRLNRVCCKCGKKHKAKGYCIRCYHEYVGKDERHDTRPKEKRTMPNHAGHSKHYVVRTHRRVETTAEAAHAIALYRAEKKLAAPRTKARQHAIRVILARVDAEMAAERERVKCAGRPRRGPSITVGRRVSDPQDILVRSVGGYWGSE